jgi:hypothetical protein
MGATFASLTLKVCPQHYSVANRRNAVFETAPELENAPHWKLRNPKTNNVTLVLHHPKEESPPVMEHLRVFVPGNMKEETEKLH